MHYFFELICIVGTEKTTGKEVLFIVKAELQDDSCQVRLGKIYYHLPSSGFTTLKMAQ